MSFIDAVNGSPSLNKLQLENKLFESASKRIDTQLESLMGTKGKEGIKKTSQGFAALFVLQMLQEMRKTVPDTSMFGEKSFGMDIFNSMLDEKIANRITQRESIGLTKIVSNYLEKRYNNTSDLIMKELADPAGFATGIKNADDSLSNYILKQLSPETLKLLESFDPDKPLSEELSIDLLRDMNKLLTEHNLFDEKLLKGIQLTDRVKTLMRNKPVGLGMIRLNWMLLENAYPGKISTYPYDNKARMQVNKPVETTGVKEQNSASPAVKIEFISLSGRVNRFDSLINETAREIQLDPDLIKAVIAKESSGNPDAVSKKGAKGLMQLIDSTAAELGVSNVMDPAENIKAGSRYLKQLLVKYDGNLPKALAAYNAGPGAVKTFNGIPPYTETKNFISKVMKYQESFRRDANI